MDPSACTNGVLLCSIESAWNWIGTGPLANYIQVFGGALGGGLAVRRWTQKEKKREQLRLDQAAEIISSLTREKSGLENELERSQGFDPHTWIERSTKEIRDGNAGLAIRRLREGLLSVEEPLFQTHLKLAQAATNDEPEDENSNIETVHGIRFATIALQLRPDSAEARQVLTMLQVLAVLTAIHEGNFKSGQSFPADWHLMPSINDGEAVVASLTSLGFQHRDQGQYAIYERLSAAAVFIAERDLGLTNRELNWPRFRTAKR